MGENDDDVNFFNQASSEPVDHPPHRGKNVISLKRKPMAGWRAKWQLAESGQPIPNLYNAMVVLRHHPLLHDLIRFDEMVRAPILTKQIPHTPMDHGIPRQVTDADVLAIQEEIQLSGLRRIPKATVQDAITLRANQDRFHPVREYLNTLQWDTKPRVDSWLAYYLGAEPDQDLCDDDKDRKHRYICKVGRLFLISMIARIMRPGCKADYMLILEGPQGALKSSACRILSGNWFSDNLPDLARGDAVRLSMHLRGKWLIEIAEMSSFNAAETYTLKEFLTQTEERYTPKYGRNEVHEARQCIFVGSTNEGSYLRDPTGARRFWPVRVGHIDLEALEQDRDQILAEAMHLFQSGEAWWPEREFEAEFIVPEQTARYEEDPWYEIIDSWVSRNASVRASVNELLKEVLLIPVGQFGTREQRRVSAILTRMGWISMRIMNKRWYERPKDCQNT